MKKRILSVLACAALLITSMFSIVAVPAFAANNATLTVSDATAALNETVTVSVDTLANSYMVNGDLLVTYDASVLQFVAGSVEAGSAASNFMFAGNEVSKGTVKIAFVKNAVGKGLTAGGTFFTMQFKVISTKTVGTEINVAANNLNGNSGSDDYAMTATGNPGCVYIVGGTNPANPIDFLNTSNGYLTPETAANVTVNADGSWTATDSFSMAVRLDVDIDDYPSIGLWFESDVEVEFTLYDEYANKWFALESEWIGKNSGYFPVGGCNRTGDFGGVYTWNKLPMKEGNVANIHSIYVNFKTPVRRLSKRSI